MKLHKLPNGNWVDPLQITAITRGERFTELGLEIPDRCVVHYGRGQVESMPCKDSTAAQAMVDELAAVVNKAKDDAK